jgi:hypothetical protein
VQAASSKQDCYNTIQASAIVQNLHLAFSFRGKQSEFARKTFGEDEETQPDNQIKELNRDADHGAIAFDSFTILQTIHSTFILNIQRTQPTWETSERT